MAGRRSHAQAVGLVVLFVMSAWLGLVAPASEQPAVLAEETAVLNVGQGDTLNLTLTGAPTTPLKLD